MNETGHPLFTERSSSEAIINVICQMTANTFLLPDSIAGLLKEKPQQSADHWRPGCSNPQCSNIIAMEICRQTHISPAAIPRQYYI